MKRNHAQVSEQYEAESQELDKKKSKSGNDISQPKISAFLAASPIMELCVDMVVESAVPFELFAKNSMRSLSKFAKKGASDSSSSLISDETVRQAVLDRAKKERGAIIEMLGGKLVSLTADFATLWGRSFLGK